MNKYATILLVDDDKDDQFIFTNALQEVDSSIQLTCVDNAQLGLETLATPSTRPDLIFLDLNLPLVHGFEFLKLLKNSDKLHDIPVVIYSTSSREADKVKAKELGAINFVSKPTNYDELKQQIKTVITDYTC